MGQIGNQNLVLINRTLGVEYWISDEIVNDNECCTNFYL